MIATGSIWGSLVDLMLNNGIYDLVKAGAPVNGTSGDGVGLAGPGSFLYDSTNKIVYQNTNTIASPTWTPWSLNDVSNVNSGTVQNTEYTLNSVTIPANFFSIGVRGIQVEWWFLLAANANAKNVKIYFGGTAVCTVTGSTANAKVGYACMTVLRTGSSTQSGQGQVQIDTGTNFTLNTNAAIAETDTAVIVIAGKSANTAAAAASGQGQGMAVSLLF